MGREPHGPKTTTDTAHPLLVSARVMVRVRVRVGRRVRVRASG